MEPLYNPQLAAAAEIADLLFAPFKKDGFLVLRLALDYKDQTGVDCNIHTMVVARPEIDTGALIERLRNDLPAGCKLTAIWSIDHKRPIYFPRSTLVELFAEAGKRAPEATEAAMEVFGVKLLTLEEIRAENK